MITYLKGDATYPQGDGNKIIAHICNDVGGWGAGFVLAISARWPLPEQRYREWHYSKHDSFKLGSVQFIGVENTLWVANIIGQHGIGYGWLGTPPIRYDAVSEALKKIDKFAKHNKASVHMPRIGCGLAGGKWDDIEKLITSNLEVEVFVYDLV